MIQPVNPLKQPVIKNFCGYPSTCVCMVFYRQLMDLFKTRTISLQFLYNQSFFISNHVAAKNGYKLFKRFENSVILIFYKYSKSLFNIVLKLYGTYFIKMQGFPFAQLYSHASSERLSSELSKC